MIVEEVEAEICSVEAPPKKAKERGVEPEPLSLSEVLRRVLEPLESDDSWVEPKDPPEVDWEEFVRTHPAFTRDPGLW